MWPGHHRTGKARRHQEQDPLEDPSRKPRDEGRRACRSLLRPQARLQPFHQREDPGRPRCQVLEGDSGSEHERAQLRELIVLPVCRSIRAGSMSEDSSKQEKRQILPQDYYDSRQVMALLKLSKQKYYELINRDDDPLPMRMYGWSTRGALAERGELMAWFKRNTRLARDSKRRR